MKMKKRKKEGDEWKGRGKREVIKGEGRDKG